MEQKRGKQKYKDEILIESEEEIENWKKI